MRLHRVALPIVISLPNGVMSSTKKKLQSDVAQTTPSFSFMHTTMKHNEMAPNKFPFAHHMNGHRFLEETQERCDSAFMRCIPDTSCFSCFDGLKEGNVDWATIDPYTVCDDVLSLLQEAGQCKELDDNIDSKEAFCSTFNGCVVWDGDESDDWSSSEDQLDCEILDECNWDGKHFGFLGDGICQDFGCYNTEICGYDGGDCCEDTCKDGMGSACGEDGFYCRDPVSKKCDNELTYGCNGDVDNDDMLNHGIGMDTEDDDESELWKECETNESFFVVNKYDSWGDGWDESVLLIELDGKEVYSGTLDDGLEGKDSICLKRGCYDVSTNGGVWGNEVSWEVHSDIGGPPLAFGGAPAKCNFSVKADLCKNTCNGAMMEEVVDEDRQSYDKLSECIASSCVIQFGLCRDDEDCAPCLTDDSAEYCRTIKNYNSLVDCSMCHCLEDKPEFCETKQAPDRGGFQWGGGKHGGNEGKGNKKTGGKRWHEGEGEHEGRWGAKTSNAGTCSPEQTTRGAEAVMTYSQCSDIDKVSALVSNWDQDNFGPLDDFEECAHTYNNEKNHGGKEPLDCMRMLASILDKDFSNRPDISSIAEGVYKRSEDFCDCTSTSNRLAPSCDSFVHYKTLLHETLDACGALDEIDCPAWSQYHQPCKDSMISKFGAADFSSVERCEFVQKGCGGVGVFPAFRRLDCGGEISKTAWDFYIAYERGCGTKPESPSSKTSPSSSSKNTRPSYSSTNSSPSNTSFSSTKNSSPSSSSNASPTSSVINNASSPSTSSSIQVAPSPDSAGEKYVPYSASEIKTDSSEKKKSSHGFLKFLAAASIIAGGVVIYRRRQAQSSFDLQRYRRQRSYANDQNDLYSGLTGGSTGSSFEPPTLPPTPSAGFV